MSTVYAKNDFIFIVKVSLFILLTLTGKFLAAQEKVVRLYSGAAPGSESWTWIEKEGINPLNNTRFAYNITTPTLTIYTPEASVANGTAVLLVPGGGMHVVMMEHEGIKTANELVKKGITVFILKYRVVQLKTANPWQEMMAKTRDTVTYKEQANQVRQLASSDVKEALAYIYSHAGALKLDKNRVGVIGFSAGAVMLLHLLTASAFAQQPAFTGFIYGVYPPELKGKLNNIMPPAFFAAATDDLLAPAQNSIDLFSAWMQLKTPAELHIYAKGGHGLNGSPANTWMLRFAEWLDAMNLMKAK